MRTRTPKVSCDQAPAGRFRLRLKVPRKNSLRVKWPRRVGMGGGGGGLPLLSPLSSLSFLSGFFFAPSSNREPAVHR